MPGSTPCRSIIDMVIDTVVETVPAAVDEPDYRATAFVPPPVIGGQTWYSNGAKARSATAGSAVSLYAVGALQGVPYVLTLSRPWTGPASTGSPSSTRRPHRHLGGRTMSRLRWATSAALVTLVVSGAPGAPPALAQTLAGRVYVANAASDNVAVLGPASNAVIATVPVGDQPFALAVARDASRLYVANEGSSSVSVIDTATNAVVATVAVGNGPTDVEVTPDGTAVWVANAGGSTVSIIDTGTDAVVATVPVGVGPRAVAFSPDGSRAYVALATDNLAVVNTTTRTVITTVPAGHSPHDVKVLPSGSKIYVADSVNWVRVVDATTLAVVATIPIGRTPGSLAVHPNGTRVYVGTDAYVAAIDTASDTVVDTAALEQPDRVAVSPAGDRLYVTTVAERVTVLDPATLDVLTPGVVVGLRPQDIANVTFRAPVIAGSTWFTSGAKARSGPAGSPVAAYAVGAIPGVPYRLVLSRTSACADTVAVVNPVVVVPGSNHLIGAVRGTIPAGTPAGTYWLCFRQTAGGTATGVVSFTVT